MAPFKSSKGRNVGKPVKGYKTSSIGDALSPQIASFSASGGIKIPKSDSGSDYTFNVFLSSGTFEQDTETSPGNIYVLVVAGGGAGGGRYYAGGGGGGGVVYTDNLPFAGTASVVVGAGGAGVSENVQGNNGTNSSFDGVTAIGGGGGGSYNTTKPGVAGGSAGGSSGYLSGAPGRIAKTPQPVPSDWTAYGNNGGGGESPQNYGGGGGGGSGAVGFDGGEPSYPVSRGGDGGAGQAFPVFPAPVIAPAIPAPIRPAWTPTVAVNGYFAGGGGGGNYYTATGHANGGVGGGGQGASSTSVENPTAGVDYTGGGGGGANSLNPGGGKEGGDGIVIVAYL